MEKNEIIEKTEKKNKIEKKCAKIAQNTLIIRALL